MGRVAVIGAPSSMGARAPGPELAPQALRDAGLLARLRERGVDVHDRGDLPVRRWAPDPVSPNARNLAAVLENHEALTTVVRSARLEGERVLVLGGDATNTLAPIASFSGGFVVYLAIHGDLNVPVSAPDGSVGRTGLGHALHLPGAHPRLAEVCALAPADIVLLGFAEGHATEYEREHVVGLGLTVVSQNELSADPVAAARRALTAVAAATGRPIIVHFAVDVIDFNEAPLGEPIGAGAGVTFAQAITALTTLLADPRVCAISMTDHNPLYGARDGSDTVRLADALADAIAGDHGTPSSSSSARLRSTPPA